MEEEEESILIIHMMEIWCRSTVTGMKLLSNSSAL